MLLFIGKRGRQYKQSQGNLRQKAVVLLRGEAHRVTSIFGRFLAEFFLETTTMRTLKLHFAAMWMAMVLAVISPMALAQTPSGPTVPVTIDNYNRAQSDVYFALIAKGGGFGKFRHGRDLAPIGQGGIIRPNRDTLYSLAVFDLDAGPVTITLPDPDKHLMTMQIINEDQYTQPIYYGAGSHTLPAR